MVYVTTNVSNFTSWTHTIAEKLEVPHDVEPTILRNKDLDPMQRERRVWGMWSFFGYWGVPTSPFGRGAREVQCSAWGSTLATPWVLLPLGT